MKQEMTQSSLIEECETLVEDMVANKDWYIESYTYTDLSEEEANHFYETELSAVLKILIEIKDNVRLLEESWKVV